MQTVDTIVIGAGIAGASVAWQLVQPGAATMTVVATVKAGRSPWGVAIK